VHASVARTLQQAGCVAADEEADELLEAAAGDARLLEEMVERRASGEPLAWVTGTTTFCGLTVRVDPGVYVPRWQTEPLARTAASVLPADGVAVDICTGAGAIAMVLRDHVPSARVVATEIDPVAAACARRNSVEVYEGHLDEPLPRDLAGRIDVITAVVPYVPTDELHFLPRDVQAREPRIALDGGDAGLNFVAELVPRSLRWLKTGGWLFTEIGGDQAPPTRDLLSDHRFTDIAFLLDEEDELRGICGRAP
jgi:release factor glutamine methyltransferase